MEIERVLFFSLLLVYGEYFLDQLLEFFPKGIGLQYFNRIPTLYDTQKEFD